METELTLDPADWDAFSVLAHQMLDDALTHMKSVSTRPAWQEVPKATREALSGNVPWQGVGAETTYTKVRDHVMPYTNGNGHPRFFGWAQGNGTPLGMMADMLAAAINPHMAGFAQAPALVEEQVIRWFVEIMGFPASAGGVLALGGTMANVLGLAVARNTTAGYDVRSEGMRADGGRLAVYASSETHGWIYKAAELMGLGRTAVRQIPVDSLRRIDLKLLKEKLKADRSEGWRPICVVGSAGTVNTGAIDDFHALADLCKQQNLWLHVDGALGALAMLSKTLRPRLAGIERADSLAFDLHKWMYQPFDVACVLVRDVLLQKATFASTASYIAAMDRGVIGGGLPFADLGVDLTRGFRALKVWMAMQAHGVDTLGSLCAQNVEQAEELGRRITQHPELELLAPVTLNIVCFRYKGQGETRHDLNGINQELLLRVQESGVAVPSSTILDGQFALRCAFVNHRTRRSDLDVLIDAVVSQGQKLCL